MAHDVIVPTINSNDESCVLRERRVESGASVRAGQTIAVLETSKATCDLDVEQDGVLEWCAQEGEDCRFGAVIARVFASDAERRAQGRAAASARAAAPGDAAPAITRPARELMARAGLDEAAVLALGLPVVRARDVEALLARPDGARGAGAASGPARADAPDTAPAARRRERISRIVTRSHREIPKAFLLVKVWCDETLRVLAQRSADEGLAIGLPELLVSVLGRLEPGFEAFLGGAGAEGRTPGEEAEGPVDVGVTIDAGQGLFVPVVRDAGRRSLREIAETLVAFRLKALRDEFTEADLAGGHLSVSLHAEEDVVFAVPLLVPGQTCMLSLGGVAREARPSAHGDLVTSACVHLGLAYDHRAIDGAEAMRFARRVKARLEQPHA